MESSSKFREWMSSISDSLNEQVWFQELKTKWEELDPQSRVYLQFAAAGVAILLLLFFILSSIWRVYSLKSELSERRTLLHMLQSANDEVRKTRDTLPAGALQEAEGEGAWTPYFEGLAGASGLDRSLLSVSGEKAGTSTDQTKETLFDLSLKHVNIKQVVRYAFALENGQRPVKLRNLSIDTKNDPSGYLDATLAVSAFVPVVQK
jgi:hypothetical protein